MLESNRSIRLAALFVCCLFQLQYGNGAVPQPRLSFSNYFPKVGGSIEIVCSLAEGDIHNVTGLAVWKGSEAKLICLASTCLATLSCPNLVNIEIIDISKASFTWFGLRKNDTGSYYCGVENCENQKAPSPEVQLTVVTPPPAPHITASTQSVYENEAKSVRFNCSGDVGEQAGSIALKQISANGTEVLYQSQSASDSTTVSAITDVMVTYTRDNVSSFQCVADNGYNHTAFSSVLKFDVEYPPNEVLLRSLDSELSLVGDSPETEYSVIVQCGVNGVVMCSSNANPQPRVAWTWTSQNETSDAVELISAEGSSLALVHVNVSNCDKQVHVVVQCNVQHTPTQSGGPSTNLSTSLTIKFLPTTTTELTGTTTSAALTTSLPNSNSSSASATPVVVTSSANSDSSSASTSAAASYSTSIVCPSYPAATSQTLSSGTSEMDYTVWLIVVSSVAGVLLVATIVLFILFYRQFRRAKRLEETVTRGQGSNADQNRYQRPAQQPRPPPTAPSQQPQPQPQPYAAGYTSSTMGNAGPYQTDDDSFSDYQERSPRLRQSAAENATFNNTNATVPVDALNTGFVYTNSGRYANQTGPIYSTTNKEAMIL